MVYTLGKDRFQYDSVMGFYQFFNTTMKKTTKVTNIVLTPGISDYLDKKLGALDRYLDPNDDSVIVDVEIAKTTNRHRSGDIFKAEATLHGRQLDTRAEVEREDLYAAIDGMKDELIETLRSKKHKRIDFIRRSGLKLKNLLRGFRKND